MSWEIIVAVLCLAIGGVLVGFWPIENTYTHPKRERKRKWRKP